MDRKLVLVTALIVFHVSMSTLAFNIQLAKAESRTWTVDDDGPADFRKVQEAINLADRGDTIFVRNGTYYENIIVNKTLTLVGEESTATIVDGNQKEFVVSITCSAVKVEGFTFCNTSMINSSCFGIIAYNVTNCFIQRNILHSNYCGIGLISCINSTIIDNNIKSNMIGIISESSPNCTISNNTLLGNLYKDVLIKNSDNCTIYDNYIANSNNGICTEYSNNCTIKNNTVQRTEYYGIQIYSSYGSKVSNNTVNENYHIGISIQYSMNCTIAKNVMRNNKNWYALEIYSSNNTQAVDNILDGNYHGIQLWQSNDCEICGNEVNGSSNGIYIGSSDNNKISYNTIKSNFYGLLLLYSNSCVVTANTVNGSNYYGIWIMYSSKNVFFHNNFFNNRVQALVTNSANMWNESEGNYWSNYRGVDLYSGPYQNKTSSDGIGDSEHVIGANNIDHYPLMGRFFDFPVDWVNRTYLVTAICNSTISDFQFGVVGVYPDHASGPPWTTSISFNMTGNAVGFCRIGIPKDVLDGDYSVTFDGFNMSSSMWKELLISNETTLYLYLTYPSGSHKIWIMGTTMVPEFSQFIILPLFMTATLLAVIVYRGKRSHCGRL